MKKSLFDFAIKTAKKRLFRHPEFKHFPHFSFIIQNNRMIDCSMNVRLEPPVHYGYHRLQEKGYRPKFHSEIRAYRKARGIMNDDHFEIINIRLSKTGEIRLSKPCRCCYALLKILGCKRFYYSSPCGFLMLK